MVAITQGNFIQPVCITAITSSGIVCPAGSSGATRTPTNLFNPNSFAYLKDIWSKLPLSTGAIIAATTSQFFPDRTLLNFPPGADQGGPSVQRSILRVGQVRKR